MLLQERLDPGLLLRDLRRKRDQRLMVVADVVGRLRLRGRKAPGRLRHDGPDHVRNQFAHQFRTAPGIIERGVLPVDLLDDRPGERHRLEIVDAKQAGTQPVVDIVGVIGDVVGKGCDLRFQRGVAR